MNMLFLGVNLILLWAYMYLKGKKVTEDFFLGIAIGDIVFLVVIIPLFSFANYAVFYIVGMCFSLILHIIVQKRKLDERKTVPLAGYLSFFLMITLFLGEVLGFDFYNGYFL
ncbi:hypothetical protein [Tenacibaculum sp.]|uniref:hypothetical protein n=1 Tax=Tenacibaculum sp. TaxID=1906242 RepID=UPI003D0E1FBC